RTFWVRIDASAVRPDYDLDAYRRGEGRTTEEKFARSLLAEIDASTDVERKRVLEEALYYGLDALHMGDVAPRYAFGPGAGATGTTGATAATAAATAPQVTPAPHAPREGSG